MASPHSLGGDDEQPRHLVSVGRFFMARGLVSQAEWQAVTLAPAIAAVAPSPAVRWAGSAGVGRPAAGRFAGDERPVENISWTGAQSFCERLSRQTGRAYRLPSEAKC
jgi:formylglycine-generating enzyme required for sulfatase activity